MARPEDFRELLYADVSLLKGFAQARQVAAALLKYWDRRERTETTLAEELAKIAGLTKEQEEEVNAEVERLVAASSDDPELALTRRGGLAHELHAAVSRKDSDVSRQLTELGAGIRVALRTLPQERYLDFMPVGEGGMGIVYWAMDTELGRQVAFKVVRPPVDGPGAGVTPPAPIRMRAPDGGSELMEAFEELKARFLQEAWVTGGMEHPGIVPVYELGRTEGGVPYYTMRFVRGRRTLETAIDELEDRPFEERTALLEPFLKICDAISYAHNRGVVHRDLKPANVALGEYGETIVLDWGLAKLSGHPDVHASRWQANVQEFRDTTDMATLTSALGTPGYMAPEAAAGDVDKVDHLSDVYSLGAMLFEILTGRTPFEFRTFREYADKLMTEDAPAANTVDPAIPAALSSLCASALARDRNLRPAGAAELAKGIRTWQKQSAQDREFEVLMAEAEGALTETEGMTVQSMLKQSERAMAACQRVLDHRPGEQRARTLLERARRLRDVGVRTKEAQARKALVRRLMLGALVVLVVLGAVVAYVLEQRRKEAEDAREVARVERDRAAEQRSRAEQAMGFITNDLREALEPVGRLDVLIRIGEEARRHYAKVPIAEDSPETFARRMRSLHDLGEVYLASGRLPEAREVFVEAAQAGDTYGSYHPDSAAGIFLHARAITDIARVDRAQGFPKRGADQLVRVVELLDGKRPNDIPLLDWEQARVRAHMSLGAAYRGQGRYPEGHASAERAHNLARELLAGAGKDDNRTQRIALRAQLSYAIAQVYTVGPGKALASTREAVSKARLWSRNQPRDVNARYLLAAALRTGAFLHRVASEYEQSIEQLEEARDILTALIDSNPENWVWRFSLASVLADLGDTRGKGDSKHPPSAADYRAAFSHAMALHKQDETHANWINLVVTLHDRMAAVASHSPVPGQPTHVDYRREAVTYAQKLSRMEADNPRWRVILAYALDLYSDHAKEDAFALNREARGHIEFALERIPTASDVPDMQMTNTSRLVQRAGSADEAIAAAQRGFNTLMRIAKDNPLVPSLQLYVWKHYSHVGGALNRHKEAGAAERERQSKLAQEWLRELMKREDVTEAYRTQLASYLQSFESEE